MEPSEHQYFVDNNKFWIPLAVIQVMADSPILAALKKDIEAMFGVDQGAAE